MDLNVSWLEDASSVNAVEPVFNQGLVSTDMGQLFSYLFGVGQLFSEFVL